MSGQEIRQAVPGDAATVAAMLREAAAWVDALGVVMWEDGELESAPIEADVAAGMYFLAIEDGQVAGAVRYQLHDALFWPDQPAGESAFVHRLVVCRAFKGRGIAPRLLHWAMARAGAEGRRWLRLDCDADRPKLRALYESCGFRLHSYRHVGPYDVSRYQIDVGQLGR